MKDFTTLKIEFDEDIATILLNRPEVHNAYNEVMINELAEAFKNIGRMSDILVVILRGKGKSFCSGADLDWMKNVVKYTYDQNYFESLQLSKCLYTIYTCKKPTIAISHGAVIGGANGLISACDFSFCEDDTTFSFNDVKLGIVPAVIAPYVIKRIGEFSAREIMLPGKKFKGKEAENYKLVNKSFQKNSIDSYLQELISQFRTSGPSAMAFCKNLIYDISNSLTMDEAIEYTAKLVADVRASDEGQEGMASYLKKRKPYWVRRG